MTQHFNDYRVADIGLADTHRDRDRHPGSVRGRRSSGTLMPVVRRRPAGRPTARPTAVDARR